MGVCSVCLIMLEFISFYCSSPIYNFMCIVLCIIYNTYFSMHAAIFVVAWLVFAILRVMI